MIHRRGFTLVELLVVIGIIALLISVLLPALNKARAQANFAKCLSNQRQLLTALFMYTQDNRGLFPGGDIMVNGARVKNAANWDTNNARNPFSLNGNEAEGPVWLYKYAKGGPLAPLMFCPSDGDEKNRFDSPAAISGVRRTSYWYSQTLFYPPEAIFASSVIGVDQRPARITQVKHTSAKAAIADEKNYHSKGRIDRIDRLTRPQDPNLPKVFADIAMGFVDGHVERVNMKQLFDPDINWTGQKNESLGFTSPATAGIKGRDLR